MGGGLCNSIHLRLLCFSSGKLFVPSSPVKKINGCSTTLLYETPSGFAIVSCDELDPKIPVEVLVLPWLLRFEQEFKII